jgi:hypothetical protein
LAELERQNWLKLFQTGRISLKSAPKKSTMGQISAKLDDIRPESVAEIKSRAFDRF